MVNYKQFYTNNKPVSGKTKCCEEEQHNAVDCSDIIPQKQGDYLKTKNYLSEYSYSSADRERVLENLGIDSRLGLLDDSVADKIRRFTEEIDDRIGALNILRQELNEKALEMHNELYDRVPIYTSDLLEVKPKDIDKYLIIPSDSDLDGDVTNNTATSINGTYLDILFKSLKALQSEVAKLRNSFRFGINSFQNSNTALSYQLDEIQDVEEEPLWAVDPEALSFIDSLEINENNTLSGGSLDLSIPNQITINGQSVWLSENTSDNTDSKIVLFLTCSNSNIKIVLKDQSTNQFFTLDLEQIIGSLSTQNIMIIISRETSKGGKNYIYIVSDNCILDQNITSGYYNTSDILQDSPYYLNQNYSFYSIIFTNNTIYKVASYSKYQDFSNNIIPSKPNDNTYKYEAAHITIRSVDTYDILKSIAKTLQNSELVYCKGSKKLYIIDDGKIQSIGGSGSSDTPQEDEGMTQEQLIEHLENMGIVTTISGKLELSKISDIVFINNDTNDKFKVAIDPYGKFKIDKVETKTLSGENGKVNGKVFNDWNVRGFVGELNGQIYNSENQGITLAKKDDYGLYGDRVKIGAVYAPLNTDTIFGCTHNYIELENTSTIDFPLDGCYLHYCESNPQYGTMVRHLELSGKVPAQGTYLIRCAKCAEENDPNVFIKVNSYDIEWYSNGKLLKLTSYQDRAMGIALTYGLSDLQAEPQENSDPRLYDEGSTDEFTALGLNNIDPNDVNTSFKYLYRNGFIDAIYIGKSFTNTSNVGYWAASAMSSQSNAIYKNTFELDPAKQAFQSTTKKESSRFRWEKPGTDYQQLSLKNEYIKFPKTDEMYPVSRFTPKASFEGKNVCTDKSKLNLSKPNMVTCSFGIDIYKTRCFNWISGGLFDEYVWIKDLSDNTIWHKFESYKEGDHTKVQDSNESYPKRKEFNNADIINCIYKRITGRFPADNTQFTSHKCIINIKSEAVQYPTTYTYVVGRADKDGNPDFEHCSEEQTFTLYPQSYTPRIYQITDQQGFHWIEYQVWAAAAKVVNDKIDNEVKEYRQYTQQEVNEYNAQLEGAISTSMINPDTQVNYTESEAIAYNSKLTGAISTNDYNTFYKGIIPILINTGDMTQNGTRINEWLDYYNAGKCLFNHLEQMNVVGNNDLCGTNEWELGTGDDIGKSNSFYFHLFYCYEINPGIVPIVNNKYIPSLYYFDSTNTRYLMVNSEITLENCKNWFNLKQTINSKVVGTNIYTGFSIPEDGSINQEYTAIPSILNFTPIYDQIYNMTNNIGKEVIAVCHELPFTVITRSSLVTGQKGVYRSISDKGKLVGSHLNQLCDKDTKKGIYWFSRLMEHIGAKLVIGGHKHTYTCTYPIREYYYYDSNTKNSKDNGKMPMQSTLQYDDVNFQDPTDSTKNLSKFPLTRRSSINDPETGFYPITAVPDLQGGITYFMCQATGYKLTSNKELPSPDQKFSIIVPNSGIDSKGQDSADNNQKYPMFSIIDDTGIKLARIRNIFNNSYKFNQLQYGNNESQVWFLLKNQENEHGTWGTTEDYLIEF